MAVPSEIERLLQGAEISAHATLGSSIAGPIGETHLVVAGGALHVFSRESLVGAYEKLSLDNAHPPRIEPGDFSYSLHVTLADGATYELSVSSFERDAVQATLAGAGDGPSEVAGPKEKLPEKPAASPPPPPPSPVKPLEPKRPAQVDAAPKSREYSRGSDRDALVVYGTNPGAFGCIVQIALLVGGISLLWWLHILAIEQLGALADTRFDDDGVTYNLTKVVAVICGAYVGGRMSKLFGHVVRRRNWAGRAVIDGDRLSVFAPKNVFMVAFDTRQPIDVRVLAHSMSSTQDTSGKPTKRSFKLYARLDQPGNAVTLTASQFAESPQLDVEGLQIEQVSEKPPQEIRQLDLTPTDLAKVLQHLRGRP